LIQHGGKDQWIRSRPGGPEKDGVLTQEWDFALLHDKRFRDVEGMILIVAAFPALPQRNTHDTDQE
jgi:hypothetical protein